MIGQENNKLRVKELIEKNKFPRFSIIHGEEGSGKRTLANYIANELKVPSTFVECRAEAVRESVKISYKVLEPIVYIIPDASLGSYEALNAILKVTEEQPNNVYYILTATHRVWETLESRAYRFYMEPYSLLDLTKYIDEKGYNATEYIEYCTNIGDIERYNAVPEFDSLKKFVVLVHDNIDKVSGANALKIAEKLDIKGEGYSLKMFWELYQKVLLDCREFVELRLTSRYYLSLANKSINKQMLFDEWLLAVRSLRFSKNNGNIDS